MIKRKGATSIYQSSVSYIGMICTSLLLKKRQGGLFQIPPLVLHVSFKENFSSFLQIFLLTNSKAPLYSDTQWINAWSHPFLQYKKPVLWFQLHKFDHRWQKVKSGQIRSQVSCLFVFRSKSSMGIIWVRSFLSSSYIGSALHVILNFNIDLVGFSFLANPFYDSGNLCHFKEMLFEKQNIKKKK